jgi:hypothetical protein
MSTNDDYEERWKKEQELHAPYWEERWKKECPSFIEMLEHVLDFKTWGFRLAYTHIYPIGHPPYVIYDSEKCRVKFALMPGDRYQSGFDMSVYYGRSHAPNVGDIITWNGEECWSWHRVNEAINFLDGLSPQQAVDQAKVKRQWWPDVPWQFLQTEVAKKLMINGDFTPELWVNMQKVIWTHYGERLFDIFDVRHPDLWEQYVLFAREYYRIRGRPSSKNFPAEGNIC